LKDFVEKWPNGEARRNSGCPLRILKTMMEKILEGWRDGFDSNQSKARADMNQSILGTNIPCSSQDRMSPFLLGEKLFATKQEL
jgi:hypothetical protein